MYSLNAGHIHVCSAKHITPILHKYTHTDLKLQGLSSSPINSPFNLISPNQLVLIRHTSQLSLGGIILPLPKVVILGNRIPIISRIEWLLGVDKLVALNQQLGTLARVDAVTDVFVVVVVQVTGAKAE